jgi:uncharacterized protein (DUF1800 family)
MAAKSLPPLDKLDPARAWQAWEPSAEDPWGLKWAGHLYRRAGFGATPAEMDAAVKRGHKATLDLLMAGEPGAAGLVKTLNQQGLTMARRYNPQARFFEGRPEPIEVRAWWLWCMLVGRHPLREKMTLFWHNHFATSIGKVQRAVPMVRQNNLLREHALGKFGPMLQAISKDPAMLIWLDSNNNIKGRANENYAREVMELFSLGVGNYKEKDIQEAARAFTGWHTDGDEYEFNVKFHDDGVKTVFGQTGNFNGNDVVDLCLKQPYCARFLCKKLFTFFISENDAQVPPATLLEPLAEQLRKSDYDIAGLVRTILSSRLFYSEHAFRQKIKSPVEYVLGAVRSVAEGDIPAQVLVTRLDTMGQALFAPPNVKGWPGAGAWLNTSTILARQNFAQALAMGTLWRDRIPNPNEPEPPVVEDVVPDGPPGTAPATIPNRPEEPAPESAKDPARLIKAAKATKPEEIVRVLLDAFLPGGISASKQQKLVAFLAQGSPTGPKLDRRIRETVHQVLSLPEYQLS